MEMHFTKIKFVNFKVENIHIYLDIFFFYIAEQFLVLRSFIFINFKKYNKIFPNIFKIKIFIFIFLRIIDEIQN